MKRRDLLKFSVAAGALAAGPAAVRAAAEHAPQHAVMDSNPPACPGDGTPAQFTPKRAPDPTPLVGELEKFPTCIYCGMDRREHHRARMLVQYSDDRPDGVCSIHCLAVSLSLNIDREPKHIWGPDYGSSLEPRPLLPVENLGYLIGADLKHAMTRRSKHSFASNEVLGEFRGKHGGNAGDFNEALKQAYLDMAEDVRMIRAMREERRKRAEAKKSA